MKTPFFAALALIATLLAQPFFAMETDQYNLPPVPLADIGEEVSQYVQDELWAAVARLNAEIEQHEACLNGAAAKDIHCHSDATERRKIAELQTNDAVAKAVFKL